MLHSKYHSIHSSPAPKLKQLTRQTLTHHVQVRDVVRIVLSGVGFRQERHNRSREYAGRKSTSRLPRLSGHCAVVVA